MAKKDILDILIATDGYMTRNEIYLKLKQSNVETIQTICHEINYEYESLFGIGKQLIESNLREGFKFIGNLKYLHIYYEHILSNDLDYQLLTESYFRCPDNDLFIERYAISMSTLRRRVQALNSYLQVFNLKITMKGNLKLEGPEYTRRMYVFLLMNYIHASVKNIKTMVNTNKYLDISKKLNRDLSLEIIDHRIESLALLIFMVDYAINMNYKITFPEVFKDIIADNNNVPDKPSYLSYWSMDEWKFFCLIVTTQDMFTSALIYDIHEFRDHMLDNHSIWTYIYEQHFNTLTPSLKTFIELKTTQIYVSLEFINLDDDMLKRFFIADYDYIKKHDTLTEVFENMWEEYILCPQSINNPYYKLQSYLLVRSLYSAHDLKVSIKIFMRVVYGSIYSHHVQTKIKERFTPEYHIEFVDNSAEADLIIASRLHEKDNDFQTVYISEQFTSRDFNRIYDVLKYIKKLETLESRSHADDYVI